MELRLSRPKVVLGLAFGVAILCVAGSASAQADRSDTADPGYQTTTTLGSAPERGANDQGLAPGIEYKPDPKSPTTTVPEKSEPVTYDSPEDQYVVYRPGSYDNEGNLSGSRREVYDAKSGELRAVAEPGEDLDDAKARARSDNSESRSVAAASSSTTQSDHVFLNDITANGVYAAEVDAYIYERGGSCDPDSCSNGQNKLTGYVWFNALQATIGTNASNDYYGMHAGIARGNGISANWFFDWSGYNSSTGSSLGTGKGHSIGLQPQRWYRIRIWRLNEIYPGVYNWGAWVLDRSTGVEQYAGSWALSSDISNVIYWMELGETNDPCRTDILGVHNINPGFWLGPYPINFSDAHASYLGPCDYSKPANRQTNLSSPSSQYTIDDRQKQRTTPHGALLWT